MDNAESIFEDLLKNGEKAVEMILIIAE